MVDKVSQEAYLHANKVPRHASLMMCSVRDGRSQLLQSFKAGLTQSKIGYIT